MANETEQQQNDANQEQNAKQGGKGYRRKGLVSEKVLLERLSDMSIEDSVINPVITLSSVEGDDSESSAMESCDSPRLRSKGTLKPSLSLDVPTMKLENEAKRPPL